jgi:glycosyltransferase involved in cell wall biosynthesis
MRVLITSSIYPTPGAPKIVGGAEIFARRLAESLVEAGDTVEVVRAETERDQPVEECNGVTVYSAPVQNIYPPFSKPRSAPVRGIWHAIEDWQSSATLVSKRIQAFKPDCMHSNNLSGLTAAIWKSALDQDVPVVHTLHDYYLTCPRCSRFMAGHACERTCLSCEILTINRKRATRQLHAVVGVSQRVLDIHTNLGLFSDTPLRTVIRNASTATLKPQMRVRSGTEVIFGFIGRLTVEKGIDNLVRAFATIPKDKVRLVIAGSASESEQQRLKELAPDARIEFLGFVSPEEFYAQIDVAVAPSIWEDPGPLVVADASAAGRPILGTHFGGMPEAIQPGVNGWLTAADPESMTRSILAIVENPQEIADISERLANAPNKWTFPDVVTEYRNLFDRVRQPKK